MRFRDRPIEARMLVYRLVDGPCEGEQVEAPTSPEGDELWRYKGGHTHLYVLYKRDGEVYRYAHELRTVDQMQELAVEAGNAHLHFDEHRTTER